MQHVQLSVFYKGGYLSYKITTEDAVVYQFALRSAPENSRYAPEQFSIERKANGWAFSTSLEPHFKKSVLHTLKKAKV